MGDTFVLNTQLVVSRGIYMLVELAEDSNEDIRAPALRTLYHLTNTNRRFKSILARATQDHALLAAIASGKAGSPVLLCPNGPLQNDDPCANTDLGYASGLGGANAK